MQDFLTKTEFALRPGEVTTLSIHAAQRLHVDEAAGTDLWMTREGDLEDYWLASGEDLLLRGDQITLSVDPRASNAVRLALISVAHRHTATLADLPNLLHRFGRNLVQGAAWTPGKDQVSAA